MGIVAMSAFGPKRICSPYDFEHLVDLILNRSGWERLSKRGSIQEGIDLGVENRALGEHAFVQVKSEAGQAVFQKYCEPFKRNRQQYRRMIFAVHTPGGELRPRASPAIQLWTSGKIVELVVRLGLGERVEQKGAPRPVRRSFHSDLRGVSSCL
jgi:hypothetical protein